MFVSYVSWVPYNSDSGEAAVGKAQDSGDSTYPLIFTAGAQGATHQGAHYKPH